MNRERARDSSPRTVETDTFQLGGYPFTGTFRSTPTEWLAAVQAGKKFLDSTCDTWCPITINAWNGAQAGAPLPELSFWLDFSYAASVLVTQLKIAPDCGQSGVRVPTSSPMCAMA